MCKLITINGSTFPTVKVGDHYFAGLPVNVFLTIPPAPIQRNSQNRVKKMTSIFDSAFAAKQQNTLTEVAIGIVTQDFDDYDDDGKLIGSYKKGDVLLLDGNTRKFYLLKFPQRASQLTEITAKIHFLTSMEDVKFAYYPYNNKDSAETSTDLLQGQARRYNWQPRQTMFANGNYKTALDWAATGPGETNSNLFENFYFMYEELKLLDSLPRSSSYTISKPAIPKLKSQPIMAALLIALKTYPNNVRLFDFIEKLCSITGADCQQAIGSGKLSPVEIIAIEWLGWSISRGTSKDDPWLKGVAGSTNFASKEPQLDFLLYWIEEYIQNPNVKRDFNKGVKESFWGGTWKALYS